MDLRSSGMVILKNFCTPVAPVSYTHLDVYKRQTHGSVFRVFFKHSLKVWHIFVNQIFQRNNNSLFCITKQIIIVHSCIKPVSYTHLDVYKRQLLYIYNCNSYKSHHCFRILIQTHNSLQKFYCKFVYPHKCVIM